MNIVVAGASGALGGSTPVAGAMNRVPTSVVRVVVGADSSGPQLASLRG